MSENRSPNYATIDALHTVVKNGAHLQVTFSCVLKYIFQLFLRNKLDYITQMN